MTQRPRLIPTKAQCREGCELALVNADEHVGAADALADVGKYGMAVSHLVLALEEAEKARALAKVVLGEPTTPQELRGAMYDHKVRHPGALAKSWSAGGAIMELLAERLREKVHLAPERTDEQRWADVEARHPEHLPADWPDRANDVREGGMYVNLSTDRWHSPAETSRQEFERLRVATVSVIRHHAAAYEREIVPLDARPSHT